MKQKILSFINFLLIHCCFRDSQPKNQEKVLKLQQLNSHTQNYQLVNHLSLLTFPLSNLYSAWKHSNTTLYF